MSHRDLREFIERIDKEGELARIKVQVDWKYELGAINYKVAESAPRKSPALLFENIKDYPGQSVITNLLATYSRCALAMGLPPDTPLKKLVQEYRERWRKYKDYKPIAVSDGPCKENVMKGDEVDVTKIVVPWLYERDGGPYIGTMAGEVTKHPITGEGNVGNYRIMVHDKRTLPMFINIQRDARVHLKAAWEIGKPLEMAIVIGADPCFVWTASTPFPYGVDETWVAGALRKKPLEVVKCETVDLYVPARAEYVVEGLIYPNDLVMEGPFGEWPGYFSGLASPKEAMRITCITHRDNPIHWGTQMTRQICDEQIFTGISHLAGTWETLETLSVPGVVAIHRPENCYGIVLIVSIKQQYAGHPKIVANALWAGEGKWAKIIIVVDDDIDPTDYEQVLWAMSMRMQARRGVHIMERAMPILLDPSNLPEERYLSDRMLIDACRPMEWEPRKEWGGQRFPPASEMSPAMKELVQKRWEEYGIKFKGKLLAHKQPHAS